MPDQDKTPRDLTEIALRILSAWTGGQRPSAEDILTLKTYFPSSAHLPVDEMACQVVHDLRGIAYPDVGQELRESARESERKREPKKRTG